MIKGISLYVWAAIAVIALCAPQSLRAAAGITFTTQGADFSAALYQETAIDLRVKVLGGEVKHRRYLKGGIWQFNPGWADLKLVFQEGSTSLLPDEIKRNRFAYKKVGSQTTPTYIFDERRYIVKTDQGYRWKDRSGNWIDYDNEGTATAYGDKNSVSVYFVRDEQGRIEKVEDHHHATVMTYTYNASGWLQSVTDTTGRSVSYQYEPTTGESGISARGIVKGGRITEVTDVLGEKWRYSYTHGLVTERLGPGNQSKTISYVPLASSSGIYSAPYVCTDWVGGNWTQNAQSGNWNFGGQRCLAKVQQGSYQEAFAAEPATPEDRVPYKVRDIAINGELIERFTFLYNDRKRQWTRATMDGDGGLEVTTYNERGEVVSRIRNGRQTQSLVESGKEQTRADENGNKTLTRYDSFKNPIATTYPDDSRITRRYNTALSTLLEVTNENGVSTRHAYDTHGNRIKTVAAAGRPEEIVTEYEYDAFGQRTLTRFADGTTAQATYDAKGNIATKTNGEGHITSYKNHDPLGNPGTVIDGRGNSTELTYDAAGNLKTLKTPLGHITNYDYDARGNLIKITDPAERETTLEYDARERMISTTNPLGETTTYSYNSRGLPTRITDAAGKVTRMEYDKDGNPIKTIDGNNNAISRDYGYLSLKPFKGLVNRIDYPTYSTTFSYDNRQRKVLESDQAEGAEKRSSAYGYDKVGNLTRLIDAEGRKTTNRYDAHNRLTGSEDPKQQETRYQYDSRNNLTQVINAKDNAIRRYEYDANNRLTAEILPDGVRLETRYDANGNVIQRIDAKGQLVNYEYDADNRLVAARYFTNATAAQDDANAQKSVSYAYDALDNLES